jgi:bifunctional non-homologous end joining protein LigD
LVAQLPPGTLVDGELAVFDAEGVSRLALMRHRMGGLGTPRQQSNYPVSFVIFDLLRLGGDDTMPLPYTERRRRLDGLGLTGPHWRPSPYHVGDFEPLFAATRRHGLEGLVAKRLDSQYRPGQRSRAWLKLKHRQQERFEVVGWRRDPGGAVASILIGERELRGGLTYRGSVTNGIGRNNRLPLTGVLEAILGPPVRFDGNQPRRPYLPVGPNLGAIVAYQERTPAGWLRDASYVRLINEGDSG